MGNEKRKCSIDFVSEPVTHVTHSIPKVMPEFMFIQLTKVVAKSC